jgi:tRNA (guanine26-N2/guanine27-N2)-dimethyltransferase
MGGDAVVDEGRAVIVIPDPSQALAESRLEPAWLPVFYNPVMEFNRDFSVAALQAYIDLYAPHRPLTIVEPLTATGVRSVRYALEVDGVERVIASDINESSVSYARRNASLNGVGDKVEVYRADASALLYRLAREDPTPILFVDLDPFGSPAPFLDAALTAIGHRGMLAATATDLAVLEGSKPRAALRRYAALTARIPHSREVGLRVLLGYIARVAAAHDKSIRPLASYWADHYIRVYVLVERGARRADAMLERCLGMAKWCEGLGHVSFKGCPEPSRVTLLGPLWRCSLGDEDFLSRIRDLALGRMSYMRTSARVARLAQLLIEETPYTDGSFYYETWALAASMKINMPPLRLLASALEEHGLGAARTHLSPTGLRSRASLEEVRSLLAQLSYRRRGS